MAVEMLTVPRFVLEAGAELRDVPVAFERWGRLNERADNVVLVCHALTGNTSVDQWWGPLLGPGRALDTDRYCVICANVMASPYGTASPVTVDPASGRRYGAAFPVPTIRDTVALHRVVLETLGVRQVAFAIGGSMGGMQALEWAFHSDMVAAVVPIAVGGRHSAWCIAWSEAQRAAIAGDPAWMDGHYSEDDHPDRGLAGARMIAMISYRSAESFAQRFGRDPDTRGSDAFAMQGYLNYQGRKLVDRFDANCYLRLTQSMDTHDVARGRGDYPDVVRRLELPALVVGISSDILYPLAEQNELVDLMPNAELAVIEAEHGHDSFLIEMETLNDIVRDWRIRTL